MAFTWLGFNTTTGAVGAPVDVFVHMANPAVDYSTYPGVCEYDGTESSPLGTLLWSDSSVAPPDGVWDTVNIEPAVNVVNGPFFCGYSGVNPSDTIACLTEAVTYNGNPIDVHTYQFKGEAFGPDSGGWFSYYYTDCELSWTKFNIGMRAYIKLIPVLPLKIEIEAISYTYNTATRKVYVYGYDFTPAGSNIDSLHLHYSVNGGAETVLKSPTFEDGTASEGIWSFDIPGMSAGDTVSYFAIGYGRPDPDVLADTTDTHTYVIMEGNPGHFLYVDNGYTLSDIPPNEYEGIVDVWDFGTYGAPDSSVFAFYSTGNDTQKTVIWRDWGCVAIGVDAGYGLGGYDKQFPAVDLVHCDSTWIKQHLDAGGYFWLSDQDQGYGLGICPGYGRQDVPTGSWVQQYLGIQGMWDDPDSLIGRSLNALNSGNPILSDLFSGNVGLQSTMGEIYIAPYAPLTGGLSYSYTTSFDSLDANAQSNMYVLDGGFNAYIISYALSLPSGGKVYNDGWPFDFICNPTDSMDIDQVAVDTLVQDVLDWFNVRSGISDETLKPEKMVRLLPMGIVTGEAMIKFSLPRDMVASLEVYDNTGRLVKNLVNDKLDAGLHTYRWNANVAGVYFYRLTAGDRILIEKMVVIK